MTRDVETNGVSSPPLILDDIDSVFIHECVTACNARVLELQEAHLEKEVLLLCLKRFMRTREVPQEDLEIRSLRQALKLFLLKGMLFKRALKIISENHFPGLRILYDDTTKALAKGNRSAQRMRAIFFNEELAPAFGVEPITRVELDEYLCAAAPREGALRGQR